MICFASQTGFYWSALKLILTVRLVKQLLLDCTAHNSSATQAVIRCYKQGLLHFKELQAKKVVTNNFFLMFVFLIWEKWWLIIWHSMAYSKQMNILLCKIDHWGVSLLLVDISVQDHHSKYILWKKPGQYLLLCAYKNQLPYRWTSPGKVIDTGTPQASDQE